MADQPEKVGEIAELYLGNILYALERCALAMAEEGKGADAKFYRGIGKLLAEAHGKAKQQSGSAG
jgi:hypothetical protein